MQRRRPVCTLNASKPRKAGSGKLPRSSSAGYEYSLVQRNSKVWGILGVSRALRTETPLLQRFKALLRLLGLISSLYVPFRTHISASSPTMALSPQLYTFLVGLFASLGSFLFGYDLGACSPQLPQRTDRLMRANRYHRQYPAKQQFPGSYGTPLPGSQPTGSSDIVSWVMVNDLARG